MTFENGEEKGGRERERGSKMLLPVVDGTVEVEVQLVMASVEMIGGNETGGTEQTGKEYSVFWEQRGGGEGSINRGREGR